ncbi:MAG: hypothetical protein QME52_09420 [Bacteroidota bacterium]|nr:hypothetical protein [Bacteroidota bacterium]
MNINTVFGSPLDWILSKEGQEIVTKAVYFPVRETQLSGYEIVHYGFVSRAAS